MLQKLYANYMKFIFSYSNREDFQRGATAPSLRT